MLTANYEYYRSNRENLPLVIQILLSKITQPFSCSFSLSWNLHEISYFLKKHEPHRSSISEVIDFEICAYLKAS